jgi:hypothetical protein
MDPTSGAALASAVIRGLFDGVVRLDVKAPADVGAIDAFLARTREVHGHVVVVDQLHWLFQRRPGGFAPLQRLVEGILADCGRNAWIVVADGSVWSYATAASPLRDIVGGVVEIDALTADQLERAILSRHGMSGYGVEFHADDDLAWQLQNLLLRGEDRERRRREAWFRTLHAASAGVLGDALRLWMASIRVVDDDDERVVLGAVPRPPLTRLAQLPDEVLVTLLETTRQGWIDEDQHRFLFRTDIATARAHLAAMTQSGLLVDEVGVLRIAGHLRGPVHRVLAWRGWT